MRLIPQRLGQARLQVKNRFLGGRATAWGAAHLSTNQRTVRDVVQHFIGRRGGRCLNDDGRSFDDAGRCLNDGALSAAPSGRTSSLRRGFGLLPRERFYICFGSLLFFLFCSSGWRLNKHFMKTLQKASKIGTVQPIRHRYGTDGTQI